MSEDLRALPNEIDRSVLDNLKSSPLPTAKEIDISFFSHRHRKSTQLVGNAIEDNFIKARREWMQFDFVEFIYVTKIIVYASGYENYHELELSYIDFLSQTTSARSVRYEDGSFTFVVNAFVGGFGLRPNERWFKDSKLQSIEVRGIEQRSFADVISVMTALNAEVDSVEKHLSQYLARAASADAAYNALTSKLNDVRTEITDSEDKLSELEDEIKVQAAAVDDARKQVAISESVKRNVDTQVRDATQLLEGLSSRSTHLTQDIEDKETKLRALQNDINLFPTEIAGYVSQGAANIKMYSWLCLVPLSIIVFVTWRLFRNAENILDYATFRDKAVVEFLISRAPYVVVSFAVLAVCYTLLNRLISEIIGINRRRQDLFKISIIATDVSNASQHNLELSDVDAYNLKTETKMELLKEHLRQHIGEEFVYNPKGNLFHKLSSMISRQVSDSETGNTNDASKAH